MWSNRKNRFTTIMLALVGANVLLWLFNRIFDFTVKDDGVVFVLIFLIDVVVFVGFALLGLLTAVLLAFRPELLKRQIERSIAKGNSRHGQFQIDPEIAAPAAHAQSTSLSTVDDGNIR